MRKIHVIYQDYAKLNEVQHEPFFFSRNHFASRAWKPQGIGVLYRMLKEYRLDTYWQPFETVGPRTGIINYDVPVGSPERYIDGPRMFKADGIVNFEGNFESFSFSFGYFTNVPEIIQKLRDAITWNLASREKLK